MTDLISIPEFYKNKNILITGASGFIGKVLIEKLLRSCPDAKNIYILIREKKGQSIEARVKRITDLPLFDLVKNKYPQNISKLKPISGDVSVLNLGLSLENRRLLIDEINILFHVAASVRFDDTLKTAVFLNARGTREVCNLALEAKNLDVLVHVSTTYCNTNHKVLEERLYPAHADWRKTIALAEVVDEDTLNVLTTKYIDPLPNTYTFTKSLAEHVVFDLCNGKIPAVVYRPSIVISTFKEPFPGWLDNFNGPMGLMVACGKGVVHSFYCDPKMETDYVPVDLTVKALIISSWQQATNRDKDKLEVDFINGSNHDVLPITISQMVEMSHKVCDEVPLDNVLWPQNAKVTNCYYNHLIKVLIFHFLPALLVDGILKLTGRKPILMNIQKRIYNANMALQYFMRNEWKFINEKVLKYEKLLLPGDEDGFSYNVDDIDQLDFFIKGAIGARLYLLKEGGDLTNAKKHQKRMWVVQQVCRVLWYAFLGWLIFVKIDVIHVFLSIFYNHN